MTPILGIERVPASDDPGVLCLSTGSGLAFGTVDSGACDLDGDLWPGLGALTSVGVSFTVVLIGLFDSARRRPSRRLPGYCVEFGLLFELYA